MTISGFTMVKNAGILRYPLKESVLSILPIVDEFVIAIGNCDNDDTTLQTIQEINSSKIKVVHTTWDVKEYPKGSILAHQTDVAKSHCTGDWLLYLQADEIIHENDHQIILDTCKQQFENRNIEGLLFKYIHFWGDYNHAFVNSHSWYRREIRIIRNLSDIHSWRDAQSFRVIPVFTKEKYLQKEGTRKLNVAEIDASIYHYGWVRPPQIMGKKQVCFGDCYKDDNSAPTEDVLISEMDFGAMGLIPDFKGVHPAVMKELIAQFNWAEKLNYTKTPGRKPKHKHEKVKYMILTWIEQKLFKNGVFVFKNYEVLS